MGRNLDAFQDGALIVQGFSFSETPSINTSAVQPWVWASAPGEKHSQPDSRLLVAVPGHSPLSAPPPCAENSNLFPAYFPVAPLYSCSYHLYPDAQLWLHSSSCPELRTLTLQDILSGCAVNLKQATAQSGLIFPYTPGSPSVCLVSGHAHIPQASNINTLDAFSSRTPTNTY